MVRKVDTLRGVNSLRTLAGLDSWSHRWTYARFVIESRLGIPYRGALAPTETSVRIRRNGYEFEPRDGTTDREVLGPYNEVQTRRFILQHFSDKRAAGVFVDVGAHCGSFGILFESLFDRVLAVEPVPDNYRAMQRNIALNELQRKIRPFNVAAGATHAQGTLFVDKDDTSSLVPVAGYSGTLSVPIRPLDDLLSDDGVRAADVRLLKADVEGAELEVLAGAQRLLKEGSPVVVLEGNTLAAKKELERFMGEIGYVLVRVADGRNLCFERFPERSLLRALAFGGIGAKLLRRRSAWLVARAHRSRVILSILRAMRAVAFSGST